MLYIEQEDKEIICEQLAEVLNTLLEDEMILKREFGIVSVRLFYEENGVEYRESFSLFDSPFGTDGELNITKDILIEEFSNRKGEVQAWED